MNLRPWTFALLLSALAPASPARAEAWEVKVGLGPVFGTEFSADRQQGLGGQAYLDLGLTEYLSLTAGGGYVAHFFGPGRSYSLANAGLGLTANLDVLLFGVGLAWVPFATLQLGFLRIDEADRAADSGLGLALAIGLDYVFEENASVGLAFEYRAMLSDPGRLPGYLGITLRAGLRFLD